MIVAKSQVELVRRTAELARSSPRAWADFLAEWKNYTAHVKDQCVMAPIEQLPVSQGLARATSTTLELFEQCLALADKLAASNVK